MASVNKFIALGNLTKDPELLERGGGKVCNFSIAINETTNGKKETVYIDVESWGSVAENSNKFLKKGSLVFIDGKLKFSSWGKGKSKRNKISCRAFVVTDMTPKKTSPKEISVTVEECLEDISPRLEDVEEEHLADLDEIPW